MSNSSTSATITGWNLQTSYSALPTSLFSRQAPVPVRDPQLVVFNAQLAQSLGLNADMLRNEAASFSGNQLPEGSAPLAQAYAGHQFGYFAMLGDGRAVLLGEQVTPQGERFDIQLKGSGQTPFSRRGDGRAALGPMLREYIISEAMHGLGIPTTRSLAVVTTGEPVYRERVLQGAILTRVAASHIRVGTFEYAARKDDETLKALADYTINRHYPDVKDYSNPYLGLFKAVMDRQAALIARWQLVGFIHGVMNTDNMTLSGETIDYGPCAFMDRYDPGTVFSSIDHQGRYAYGNQPPIAQWNLARLAEALIPLLHTEPEQAIGIAQEALNQFPGLFQRYWVDGMRAKLGLLTEEPDDVVLMEDFLSWMQRTEGDFTNTFRALCGDSLPDTPQWRDNAFTDWHSRWQERLKRQHQPIEEAKACMNAHNPAVIPRNHKVEEALSAATDQQDLSLTHRLVELLKTPYADRPIPDEYRLPAPITDIPYQTFCGT